MGDSATALEGRIVTLEPLEARHRPGLREAAADDARLDVDVTTDFEELARTRAAAADVFHPFAVLHDGRVVGSTSYLSVVPEHGRLEIGNTWNTPSTWGTGANTDAKYLLLRHAFERSDEAGRVQDRREERPRPGGAGRDSRRVRGRSTASTCSSATASGATLPGTP